MKNGGTTEHLIIISRKRRFNPMSRFILTTRIHRGAAWTVLLWLPESFAVNGSFSRVGL
jgi:hypothetical protein